MSRGGLGARLGREEVRSGEKWTTRARSDGVIAIIRVSLLLLFGVKLQLCQVLMIELYRFLCVLHSMFG